MLSLLTGSKNIEISNTGTDIEAKQSVKTVVMCKFRFEELLFYILQTVFKLQT